MTEHDREQARKARWTDVAEAFCTACEREFHVSDDFETRVGAEEQCPHCGATMECVDEELTRRWVWHERAREDGGG